jgi:hypothetical protein
MDFNTLYTKEESERFFNNVKGKHIVLLTNGEPWATNMYFIPNELKDAFYGDRYMMDGNWVSENTGSTINYQTGFMVFRGFDKFEEIDILRRGDITYQWVLKENIYRPIKCECGCDKINWHLHANYCPKYK